MTAQTQGKADMVDVVTAVASAQASLSTMMAVRDQVISAYQQIMSMPL
jgi:flagellar hook-basal body complex protein FliE